MAPHMHGDESTKSLEDRKLLQSRMGLVCYRLAQRFDAKTRLQVKPIPVISDEIVEHGRLLGRGGFSEVLEVVAKRDGSSDEETWAVKRLHLNVMKNPEKFYGGAMDLISEAKILNALCHRNIIRLHGVSCHDAALRSSYLDENQYSLYLDCLYGTVDEKFDEDRRRYAPDEKKRDLMSRVEIIALPIAEAMKYLHEHNIIYRDLKPSNMGFDASGTVKLFDFGLAREIPLDSCRRMTGATGSCRYMAPEVALSQQYGLPADVYSFGIFLFECCTLIKPFDRMSRSEHAEKVTQGGQRPAFHVTCATPKSIKNLVKSCWTRSPKSRPDFRRVVGLLQREIDVNAAEAEGKVKLQSSSPLHKMFHPHLAAPRNPLPWKKNACAAA